MSAPDREEIDRRLRAFQESLASHDPPLDVAIVVESVDLYYLAATMQSAHLLVPREGEPRLLVRKVLERAREDSPLDSIDPFPSLRKLPEEIGDLCGPPPWRVGMELDSISAALFAKYQAILAGAEISVVSRDILALRSVKSAWEIEQIRAAAEINDRIYRDLPDLLSVGLSTVELQAILDCRARTAGHVGLVRMRGHNVDCLIGIVVSGPTGAIPGPGEFPIGGEGPHPYMGTGGDWNKIEADTPIAFDYLANRYGYHHDQTRMAVIGSMPPEAERIFEGMRQILRAAETKLRPGEIPSRIYEESLEQARTLGLADGFMGLPGHAVRFLGHAVGLEVNEQPVLARKFDAPLVPGNVLAVEPKFTHPEFGVIGIENTYCVTDGEPERVGNTPEDIVVV